MQQQLKLLFLKKVILSIDRRTRFLRLKFDTEESEIIKKKRGERRAKDRKRERERAIEFTFSGQGCIDERVSSLPVSD